jgi:hypothetical protein
LASIGETGFTHEDSCAHIACDKRPDNEKRRRASACDVVILERLHATARVVANHYEDENEKSGGSGK